MNELIGPSVQIVLGVIEGQGFGFLQNPVFVTGCLNGHILQSDSIPPTPSPIFATNLIWQADKKGLRLMRTGNIPMKVECYSLNNKSKKERIGYLVLSLRSIQIIPTGKIVTIQQSWHKLLGVKNEAKALHPELLLTFHVEDDSNKIDSNILSSNNLTKMTPSLASAVHAEWQHPTIVPRLCSEEGLIQIGPEEECMDIFLLTILIGTAINLDMLLPETIVFGKDTESFCFWYSIFGHSIQTKPFRRDLHEPCVLNEKIVLRVRSSLKILKVYFTEVSLVNLKLLHGKSEIGNANINMQNLVPCEDLEEFINEHAVSNTITKNDKCFLHLPGSGDIPADANDRKPFIEMEMKLKYVFSPSFPAQKESNTMITQELNVGENIEFTDRSDTDTALSNSGETTLRSSSIHDLQQKPIENTQDIPLRCTKELKDINEEKQEPILSTVSSKHSIIKDDIYVPDLKISQTSQSVDSLIPISSKQSTLQMNKIPNAIETSTEYHQYTLNIVLESVIFSPKLKDCKVQFRFHHPKAEVISSLHPEIIVLSPEETICLQNICCKINFVSTSDQISYLLLSSPPKVTLWDCGEHMKTSVQIAEVVLDIDTLLKQETKECKLRLQMIRLNDIEIVATVNLAVSLKDCGNNLKKEHTYYESALGPPILDERLAYKLVEELEDWKDKQQQIFKTELARREEARLTILNAEWTARRTELECKLARGIEQCRTLSINLTRTTDDFKIKSLKCSEAERKYKQLKDELDKNFQIKYDHLKDSSRRLEEDVDHKFHQIKKENTTLTEKLHAIERENALLKDTLRAQENELNNLQKTSLTKDQTSNLLQEVKNLEQKLESALQSKTYFKEQWAMSVREIHRIKAEHQKELQKQIQCNKEEISNLGLQQFLMKEEDQFHKDRHMLSQIKCDLDSINSNLNLHKEQYDIPFDINRMQKQKPSSSASRINLENMSIEEKAAMLIEERDILLSTGNYTESDTVIMKLNQEIQICITQIK